MIYGNRSRDVMMRQFSIVRVVWRLGCRGRCVLQPPSVSVGTCSECATTEAIAADDVKHDIEYGDDDLVCTNQGVLTARLK